jgi:hypothetical protein
MPDAGGKKEQNNTQELSPSGFLGNYQTKDE